MCTIISSHLMFARNYKQTGAQKWPSVRFERGATREERKHKKNWYVIIQFFFFFFVTPQ